MEVVDPKKAQVKAEQVLLEKTETQTSFGDFQVSTSLLREITKAIQASMEQYQGCSEGFEPSADELIDVLKNLENLAAANPALYRAIVDQIKVHQVEPSRPHQPREQILEDTEDQSVPHNGHGQHYGGQEEEFCEEEEYHGRTNGMDELDRENMESYQMETSESQEQFEEMTEEQFEKAQREEAIRQQVGREHEEQMRLLQLQARRAQEPAAPPKTITVVAGGKNRPAWPIAPGVDNGTVPRTIELTASSAESQEEMLRSRLEVAQAAGLRHVEVINGDETFYPQPIKDYDYPWAGSLRPVSNKLVKKDGRRDSSDPGTTPWSGSLRHVDENKKTRKSKPAVEDDTYGDAPWMGTLRHIKVEPKLVNLMKPQFKRYPDEDAPNPYSSTQGCSAKPCYPLSPAAVISASGGSMLERESARQDEEVRRITSNLRETRTVSSTMLRALMPKLLKEHENKVEPLDHMESIRIMEEILGMQIGLNTAAIDDDDEEAEAMIRACQGGDVDLDLASQLKKKGSSIDKKKKKKKKPTSKASTKELAEIEVS